MALRSALLVIDVQNDFCEGGALEVPQGSEVVPLINELIQVSDITVLSQDWHPKEHQSFAENHKGRAAYEVIEMAYGPQVLWPTHCVIGSDGADFHKDLQTNFAQMVVRKGFRTEIDSYSAFFENDKTTTTGLDGYLRQRDVERVTIVGLALDFCVFYTAMDARALGYEVVVVQKACRAIDLDGSLEQAISTMKNVGIQLK